MKQKLDLQKRLIPILVIFVILLLTVVFLRPNLTKALKQNENNKAAQVKIASLTEKLKQLQTIDEEEIEKRTKIIEEVFPSVKPILNLINSLERLSTEKDLEFGGVTLVPGAIDEDKEPTEETQEFIISFIIQGSFEKINNFVDEIEKTTPLMKVNSLQVSLVDDIRVENPEMKVKFDVSVYYKPFPKTIGSIDQPLPVLTSDEVALLQTINEFKIYPKIEPNAPVGKDNFFVF